MEADETADVVEEGEVVAPSSSTSSASRGKGTARNLKSKDEDEDEEDEGEDEPKGKGTAGKRKRTDKNKGEDEGAEEEEEQPAVKKRKGKVKRTKAKKNCLNTLPLARVKRILKSDPDVKLISNDAALLVCRSAVPQLLSCTHSLCMRQAHHLRFANRNCCASS
jgi:hypothetical protein